MKSRKKRAFLKEEIGGSDVRGMDPNYTHPLFAPNYTHFWNLDFSDTIQPNSAWSSLPMCVVLNLSMKEN